MSEARGKLTVLACGLLTLVLGSVHAFSVFIEPIEDELSTGRALTSLTYSLALVSLTTGVLFGPRLFHRFSAPMFVIGVCVMAALGAALAGFGRNILVLWIGYGLLFGGANGLGYGYCLQLVAQTDRRHAGLFMGFVTATYALGAFVSAFGFEWLMTGASFANAMYGLALSLLVVGAVVSLPLRFTAAAYQPSGLKQDTPGSFGIGGLMLLWVGFFCGVFSGLAVIGHAAGILAAAEGTAASWLAPSIVAVCSFGASLVLGRLVDRMPGEALGVILSAVTVLALLALVFTQSLPLMLVGLGMVGFAYGGIITVFPALIRQDFGAQMSAIIYGRVFTAWGAAGLLGPYAAGLIFDARGGYTVALVLGVGLSLVSGLALLLFKSAKAR